MHFHSHFSDDSVHNYATTFEHMNNSIHWMYEENLFIMDGIIYDTTYGCSKQYICTNSMWLLSVLDFTNRVIIDRCINAPDRGRRKIDYLKVADKKYLEQHMSGVGTGD